MVSKFNLDRAAHFVSACRQHEVKCFGEWQYPVFQDVVECDQSSSFSAFVVPDYVVAEVVGRYHVFQCSFFGDILNAQSGDVVAVVGCHSFLFFHVECAESCHGCLAERVRLRRFAARCRGGGGEAESEAAVNDVFSQSDGDFDDSVLGPLVADGVVVEGSPDTRE